MTETQTTEKGTVKPAASFEDKTFVDMLKSMIGKVVTIVNPESYEDAPVGHKIRAGFYRAKPIGIGKDFLVLATEFVRVGPKANEAEEKEPVRQYIPFSSIKRISVLKQERLIHL